MELENRVIDSLEDQLRIANQKIDKYKEEIEIYIGKLAAHRAQIEEMKEDLDFAIERLNRIITADCFDEAQDIAYCAIDDLEKEK